MKNKMRTGMKIGKFAGAVFIFLAIYLFSFAEAADYADQKALALSLRFSVSRLPTDSSDDVAKEKEALYLRIINECPDTSEAEEAYWELSNLYLDGFDEPKEKEAVAVLERFLKELSDSPWALHVNSRLKWLRGEN
ncbi:hypothetical protein AGMMS50276_16480 [Synergistales bacterium]|nr:hypothetical protein AGMMS50276_16480 [Synergistales bacterium]